jgi:hypothetical protein
MMKRLRVKRERMADQQRMMTDWVSTEKEIQRRKREKGKQNEKGLVGRGKAVGKGSSKLKREGSTGPKRAGYL